MTESVFGKFQLPHEKLADMRRLYEAVEHVTKTNRRFKEHRRKYPGRLDALLNEADKYLQQAEWVMGAVSESGRFSDKVYDLAFKSLLQLAYKEMLLTILDQPIMIGEKRSAVASKGAEATNQEDVLAEILETLAAKKDGLGDPAQPSDLWEDLRTMLDNANMHPRERGTGVRKALDYEADQDGYITYENFRKRIGTFR